MKLAWEDPIGGVGLVLLLVGEYMGLFATPNEQMMGDVVRILYVHVPAAWVSLLAFSAAFIGAAGYLFSGRKVFDSVLEASAEVGVVLGVLLMITGALFARPTWGVYWTWDARLTSTAIMVLTFFGVLVLRSLVEDPDRRATWSAVVSIFAAINVPITYYSVDWWRSIHQMQSSAETISKPIHNVLMLNALALVLVTAWLVVKRWRLARLHALAEEPEPLSDMGEEVA